MTTTLIWALLLSASPSPIADGWTRDVEFACAGNESLTLDAYVPAGKGPHPAVIVVHGGGYIRGDKQTFVPPLFSALEQAGLAIFTINYRLAPQHLYPAAVEDVEHALGFVRTHAAEYRVDPKRVALLGESAGGHLVALAALRVPPSDAPAAVVAMYTTFDFPARIREQGKVSQSMKDFFGIQELDASATKLLEEASPIHYLRKGMPPFLLVHGTADTQVPFSQSVLMQEQTRRAESHCDLIRIEGGEHGLGEWEKEKRPGYKKQIADWLGWRLSK